MADEIQENAAATDELTELRKQVVDLEAKWKRAIADFQNREKELAREREDFAKFCTAGLIRDFLAIMDAVEAASRQPQAPSSHLPAPSLPEGSGEMEKSFSPSHREGEREGVGAIAQLCLDFLKRRGITPIGAVDDRVDYLLHEIIGTRTEEGKESGTILEVAQVGYTMHGRLLRPAKVIVCEEKK